MKWTKIKNVLKSNDDVAIDKLIAHQDFWKLNNKDLIVACDILRKSEKFEKALWLQELFEHHKTRFNEPEWIDVLFLKGDIFHDTDRYQEAIDIYTSTLFFAESDIAHNNRGLAYWELGKFEEALDDYIIAIKLNPENITSLRGAGEMLNELGRPEEAIRYLSKAVRLNPTYAAAFRALGIAYYNSEDWPKNKSYQALKKAIELYPEDKIALKGIEKIKNYIVGKNMDVKFWVDATFRIKDAPHLHDEIISVLGTGTECHKRGDPALHKPGKRWPNDIWMIDSPIPETEDISKHLKWIIEFIAPHEEHIKKWIATGARIDIYIAYACNKDHRDFALAPELLDVFTRLRLPLEVSIMT